MSSSHQVKSSSQVRSRPQVGESSSTNQAKETRLTRPVLTRYERASIIGMRMEQLQRGARPFVDIADKAGMDIRNIAVQEFDERKLPFIVVRKLPDGRKEKWRLSELLS